MSLKKFPHPLLVLLIILIASLALGSCSAEWHLNQAIRKGARVEQQKWDTLVVTKERTLWDTLTLNDVDTVVVQKDNIKLRIVRNFDTIRVKAICQPDTIRVTKHINRTIKAPDKKGDWEKYLMIFAVAMLLVVLMKR